MDLLDCMLLGPTSKCSGTAKPHLECGHPCMRLSPFTVLKANSTQTMIGSLYTHATACMLSVYVVGLSHVNRQLTQRSGYLPPIRTHWQQSERSRRASSAEWTPRRPNVASCKPHEVKSWKKEGRREGGKEGRKEGKRKEGRPFRVALPFPSSARLYVPLSRARPRANIQPKSLSRYRL